MKYFLLILFLLKFTTFIDCGLYYPGDNVNIFVPANFTEIFPNRTNSYWLVQFYHELCGHCINFAPKFKEFLKEAQYWDHIVKFGVINCANYRDFCHNIGIQGFPSFKFYDVSNRTWSLQNLNHRSVEDLTKSTIQLISAQIKPEIFKLERNDLPNNYIRVSSDNSFGVKQLLLTYSNRLILPLLMGKNDNADYEVEIKQNSDKLIFKYKTLEETKSKLETYMNQAVIINNTSTPIPKDYWTREKSKTIGPVDKGRVFNQDIYASIWYALSTEVRNDHLRNSTQFQHLVNFIDLLIQYSDLNSKYIEGFQNLRNLLVNINDAENKKIVIRWKTILKHSMLPPLDPVVWIGCQGSKSHLRRYPCGLWTTFHAITAQFHLDNRKYIPNEVTTAKETARNVMKSIREFIFTYFSCRECAVNFRHETADFVHRINNSRDLMIYLWQVHNSVNKRLSGTPTDDPIAPKHAFPSRKSCPTCWASENIDMKWPSSNQWNLDAVEAFLLAHFGPTNRVKISQQQELEQKQLPNNNPWLLNTIVYIPNLDLSICVILSLSCSVLVLIIFLKFCSESSWCRSNPPAKWFFSSNINNHNFRRSASSSRASPLSIHS